LKTLERDVLRACLNYLRIKNHFVIRVNNGAFQTKKGGWVRCTDILGVADIIGLTFDGKPLAVECKSKTGKLSDFQEAFRNAWQERGGLYVLARNIEDLQEGGL
jgi:hypothetical protein